MDIEQTVTKVAEYINSCNLSELPKGRAYIWQVRELAEKAGVSACMLGKIRKNFKCALSQAITPGVDPIYKINETSCYSLNAISVEKI